MFISFFYVVLLIENLGIFLNLCCCFFFIGDVIFVFFDSVGLIDGVCIFGILSVFLVLSCGVDGRVKRGV